MDGRAYDDNRVIAGRIGGVLEWWRRFPIKAMVLISALCLALQEEYPFSHFPMYSSFSDYSYYVYVTDRSGEPIALEKLMSIRTSKLKKFYQSQLNPIRDAVEAAGEPWTGFRRLDIESRVPAARTALEWLLANCKPAARVELEARRPLAFHQVGIWVEGKEITEVDEEVTSE